MRTHIYAGVSARTGGTVSGMYRRAIGEDQWQRLGGGLTDSTHVHAIAVHPTDPSIVFAAASTGIWRSKDQGENWTRIVEPAPREQMWSILFHPSDPRVLLAGTAPLGLYRSEDGGETWRKMPRPDIGERMVGAFPSRVMRLSIAPSRPNEIWAGLEVNGAMHSADGGETWTDKSDPLVKLSQRPDLQSALLTKDTAEGMLDVHAICVSPAAPGTAFLALRMGLFRSDNGGETWDDLGIGRHAAHLRYGRDIVVAPWDPNTLFACVADKARGEVGRLYRSQDLGRSWAQFDHSVDVRATTMAVALNPRDAKQAHFVTRGGQTFSTMDTGETWRDHPLPEGAGAAVSVACG